MRSCERLERFERENGVLGGSAIGLVGKIGEWKKKKPARGNLQAFGKTWGADWERCGQEIRSMEKKKPASISLQAFEKDPAASYSPTGLPQQYHRLRGA